MKPKPPLAAGPSSVRNLRSAAINEAGDEGHSQPPPPPMPVVAAPWERSWRGKAVDRLFAITRLLAGPMVSSASAAEPAVGARGRGGYC